MPGEETLRFVPLLARAYQQNGISSKELEDAGQSSTTAISDNRDQYRMLRLSTDVQPYNNASSLTVKRNTSESPARDSKKRTSADGA